MSRRPHRNDRRVNELVVTERGKRVRAKLTAQLFAPPEALLKLSPRDQAGFRDLLLELVGGPAEVGSR